MPDVASALTEVGLGDAGQPEARCLDLVRGRHRVDRSEQRREPVLAGPVDHALHEGLASSRLIRTESDAEQSLDKEIVR